MPIDFWEKPESGKLSDTGRRIELLFGLSGTTDKFVALAHAIQNTDSDIQTIPRADVQCEVVDGHDDLWDITVIYQIGGGSGSGPVPTEIGDERESFSTRGNRVRITQALEHIADYGNADEGEAVPNHLGAINVTPDRIEGVEVDIPGWTFQIRTIVAASTMTQAYRRNLARSTHRVNSQRWRGYEPGELRLVDVRGSQRDEESFDLEFDFLAIENVEDDTVGDIEGIEKQGHHYAWAEHEKEVDESTDPPTVREKLIAVHIERVYKEIDFNVTLGLQG